MNKLQFSVKLFTVENNRQGKKTISDLRKQLKDAGGNLRLKLYGRGYRHGRGRMHVKNGVWDRIDNCYQNNLPIPKAQRIAVYLENKNGECACTYHPEA